jgi:lipopolysaccharide biosynthesis glycosyltransferase
VSAASQIHAVTVTDRAYVPWAGVALVSSAMATPDAELILHVLCAADVTEHDRALLRDTVARYGATLRVHDLDERPLAELPSKGAAAGGRISWVRVVLPDALPDVERVIYLDADILVVDSLQRLWDEPLAGAGVAAVGNVTEAGMHPHLASLGLEDPAEYFNAGVLLIDLDRWRSEGTAEALRQVARDRSSLPWYDQDALNVVFAGRWKRLHPRWNTMNSFWTWPSLAEDLLGEAEATAARQDPGILHFEGPSLSKPWHYLCSHPRVADYRAVLADTPWAGRPLEDRTVATRLIARLPADRRLPAFRRLSRARLRWSGR